MFHTPAHKTLAAASAAPVKPIEKTYTSNEIDAVRRREADVGYDELTDAERAILDSQD